MKYRINPIIQESTMRIEEIGDVETRFEDFAGSIIEKLKVVGGAGTGSRNNVMYFDGWDGLGASAVLREVHRRLLTAVNPTESLRVLHVDCSKWESRRALQRVLAEKLELPAPVMELFETKDEDDDYRGVAESSRVEIPEVGEAISRHVLKDGRRFVVIFINGSDEEIDLTSLGFPLSGMFSLHKVLWSFQGRLRLYPRAKVYAALSKTTSTTDLVLSPRASAYRGEWLRDMMISEAEEVTRDIDCHSLVESPATAATNCLLYITMLARMGNDLTGYDLATHGFNYCICDGVIKLQRLDDDDGAAADRLWRWSHALQREMRLHPDYFKNPVSSSPELATCFHDHKPFWASPTYGFMLIPASQNGRIPRGMFLPFDGLCMLKLYLCRFSFKSPPFLCCHNLRFLWIEDCCQEAVGEEEEAAAEEDLRRCFQRLWVLHVRSSFPFLSPKIMAFITQVKELILVLQGHPSDSLNPGQWLLPNVQKLRIQDSFLRMDSWPLAMDKLELLIFSGCLLNMESLPVFSSYRSLATIIIEFPHLYFSDISLKGCASLKNILLSGSFPELHSLDVSGTAVKTFDLSQVHVPMLRNLFLLSCGNLCAILWPSPENRWKNLDNLWIDTTQRHHHDVGSSPSRTVAFPWYISAMDARLLRSLDPIKDQFDDNNNVHLDISTMSSPSNPSPFADADGSKDASIIMSNTQQRQLLQSHYNNATIYADSIVALTFKDYNSMQHAKEGGSEPLYIMRVCPPPPCFSPSQGCYMHIEDHRGGKPSSHSASIAVSKFICDSSKILHIHDSLFITTILTSSLNSSSLPAVWKQLEWCRVERCPKLECVFNDVGRYYGSMLNQLTTIWLSHLPSARYIWTCREDDAESVSFGNNLTLLHLDRCPRLIYAVSGRVFEYIMRSLETIEITFCNNLRVVFDWVLDPAIWWDLHSNDMWEFPQLKCIHLHELPMLRRIFSPKVDVCAPKLETIKIRGCWSLKRLPHVGGNNTVECDCEKEWWDALQWDSNVPAESYKPTHPRHYKKTMLKGSVLR